MATPDPSNVAPWYLRNINQALALDEASGNVYVRTGFEGNIIISGNVNIPGNIDAHISEIGTSGNLTVPWMPVSIDGNSAVTISSGNVRVTQGTSPWVVSGNVNANVSGNVGVTGNVNIGTMPNVNAAVTGTVTSNQGTSPWVVSGNVNVTNQATDLTIADSTYEMNVARGLVPGQYIESKNGYATGISQNTEVTIWNNASTYPWDQLTSAQKLYVISTSASDTGQVIRIEGLDASYNKITENVTSNGTTAIATTQNFLRINRTYIISGNTNVGTITTRLTSGTGTVVGSMQPGFARNKGGFFTVPNGYTAYILYIDATQFRAGSGNIGGVLKIFTRTGSGPFLLQVIAEVVNGQYNNTLNVPLIAPEKTDIDFRIVADGNGTQATCFWQMILIPN